MRLDRIRDRLTWAELALVDAHDDLEQNEPTPSLLADVARRLADVELGLSALRASLA